MLILNRRVGEAVVIGGGVRVTVEEVHGGRVKLGFVAPPEVPIYREEICPPELLDAVPHAQNRGDAR
jgi:carbon storage regulator